MLSKFVGIIIFFFVLFFSFSVQANSNIIINEIAWAGMTDGWRYEWVELFNGSGGAVDISGWQIENGSANNKTLVLSSEIIPSNGYFLVCRKEMTGCDAVETKLSLHNEYDKNGKLVLRDAAGGVVDSAPEPESKSWPGGDNETKQTMERVENGWQASQESNGTPKTANSAINAPEANPEPQTEHEPSSEAVPDPIIIPPAIEYPENIYINEILPSPEGPDNEMEWIELYNGNNFDVNLTGWQMQDTIGAVRTRIFPTDTIINSLDFLVLERTKTKITLQNSGDGLKLLNPNQKIVYSVDYPKSPQGQSYNRMGETWEWSAVLTPAKQNIISIPVVEPQEALETTEIPVVEPQGFSNNEEIDMLSASVEKALPETSNHILTIIFAIIIAAGSGVVVLLIKISQNKKES